MASAVAGVPILEHIPNDSAWAAISRPGGILHLAASQKPPGFGGVAGPLGRLC
jgi:hypothetical protein